MKTSLISIGRMFSIPAALAVFAIVASAQEGEKAAPAVTVVKPATGQLPADFKPSAEVQPIITLAQSGVSEEILLAFIRRTERAYALSAEEIIFLRDVGLSDSVIMTLLGAPISEKPTTQPAMASAAAPKAPESATPPAAQPGIAVTNVTAPAAPVTTDQFVEALSPYGTWLQVEGYGLAWQPSVVVNNPAWRPYVDSGRWAWSNCGWYWNSDYSWGWAPFHYGRWLAHPTHRWVWCPDSTWGPSWVSWRTSATYCGWAPLPPTASYRPNVGLTYQDQNVSVRFEFGLTYREYCYVPVYYFCNPYPAVCAVPYDRTAGIHNTTTVVNNYVVGDNNVVINKGIGKEVIESASGTSVPVLGIERGGRGQVTAGGRMLPDGTRLVGDRSVRPSFGTTAPSTAGAFTAGRSTAAVGARPLASVTGSPTISRAGAQRFARPAAPSPAVTPMPSNPAGSGIATTAGTTLSTVGQPAGSTRYGSPSPAIPTRTTQTPLTADPRMTSLNTGYSGGNTARPAPYMPSPTSPTTAALPNQNTLNLRLSSPASTLPTAGSSALNTSPLRSMLPSTPVGTTMRYGQHSPSTAHNFNTLQSTFRPPQQMSTPLFRGVSGGPSVPSGGSTFIPPRPVNR